MAVLNPRAQSSTPLNLGLIVAPTDPQAQQLLQQLKGGTDFAVLAKEKSIDSTAIDGGYLGSLDPLQLRPELQPAIRGLGVGQYSEVVQIPSGFAILTIFAVAPLTHDLDVDRLKSLFSAGAVRDTIDISGQASANAALAAYPKPEGWNRDLSQVCAVRTNSYAAAVERLKAQLPVAESQPAGKVAPAEPFAGPRGAGPPVLLYG